MDIEIYDMGEGYGWGWSSISPANEGRPPLTVITEGLPKRLWRAVGLNDDLWEAAKLAWVLAAESLTREAKPESAAA